MQTRPVVTSIGNDLVDLKDYDTITNPRFKSRILSDFELNHVNNEGSSIWIYWAAKEAAYKVLKKTTQDLKFLPKKFELDIQSKTIKYQDLILQCAWTINNDYVYLYSCSNDIKLGSIHNWISDIKDYDNKQEQSKLVRSLAQEKISALLNIPSNSISFHNQSFIDENSSPKKSNYYPVLLIDNKPSGYQLSFTHHGRYVACAFWYDNK